MSHKTAGRGRLNAVLLPSSIGYLVCRCCRVGQHRHPCQGKLRAQHRGFSRHPGPDQLGCLGDCILVSLYPVALLDWGKVAHRYRREKTKLKDDRSRCRIRKLLYDLTFVMFFYSFVSQCIHNWAPPIVGEENAPVWTNWITDSNKQHWRT